MSNKKGYIWEFLVIYYKANTIIASIVNIAGKNVNIASRILLYLFLFYN